MSARSAWGRSGMPSVPFLAIVSESFISFTSLAFFFCLAAYVTINIRVHHTQLDQSRYGGEGEGVAGSERQFSSVIPFLCIQAWLTLIITNNTTG